MYSKSGHKFDPNGYCLSRGYKVEEAQTSATFRFPNNGHNIKGGKTLNKEWINGCTTEYGGVELDKDIVNIKENYISYIPSNTKLVQTMDNLSVAETGTTGSYLTLYSPCDNNQQAVHPIPIQNPNG